MLAKKVHHKCSYSACNNIAPKRCSGCRQVYYCSIKCQRAHWKSKHKKECKELKAQYVIYQTLTSIKAYDFYQMPTSILLRISEYALGAIENCQECEKEFLIMKLNSESEKYTLAANGLFCTQCIYNNRLDLCACNEMKWRSQRSECEYCYERMVCRSDGHKKCAGDSCTNAICVDCPESLKCIKCNKNNFCECCLLEYCVYCKTDLMDQICTSCALRDKIYSKCTGCENIICPNCPQPRETSLCYMKDCNGRFHSIDNIRKKCGVRLCDPLFCNGDPVFCSNFRVCRSHNEEERAQRMIELGSLNCDLCDKNFCRNCLVAGNICLYCGEKDKDGNVLNIMCRQCCDEHRCATCNAHIHHCEVNQRCIQNNQHDLPLL